MCVCYIFAEELPLITPRVEEGKDEETTGLFSSVHPSERPLLLTTPTGEPSIPSLLIQEDHAPSKPKGFKPLIEVVSSSEEQPTGGQRSNDGQTGGQRSNDGQTWGQRSNGGPTGGQRSPETVESEGVEQWAECVGVSSVSSEERNQQPLLIEEIEESSEGTNLYIVTLPRVRTTLCGTLIRATRIVFSIMLLLTMIYFCKLCGSFSVCK